MFTSNKTRAHRTIVLTAMLAKIDEIIELGTAPRGLCNILTECTGVIEVHKYLKKQRPTKYKHKAFYDSDRKESCWWWNLDDMLDRKAFVIHLLRKNEPFKIF